MTPATYELKGTLLKVEGVDLELGGKQILRSVELEIRDIVRPGVTQGQVVGLLGPSGMGKTRLFRILAGLDKPDAGIVLIGPEQEPVRRGSVGVVSQNYVLFNHRTVLGNLIVAGRQAGQSTAEAKEKGIAVLKRFGLDEHAAKYPTQLSGGQQQRVAIAQQFLCSKHFLLMDEPFSGLDMNAIEHVSDFICEMACTDELKTIIVVTHDISAAIGVCDTLWLLGRDRDANDNPIPGARIQKVYNLMDLGLAWDKDALKSQEFADLQREIREAFPRL
jgi:NitT/TauT family transport system ATP-binding protein